MCVVVDQMLADDVVPASSQYLSNGPANSMQTQIERDTDVGAGFVLGCPQFFIPSVTRPEFSQVFPPLASDQGKLHAPLHPRRHYLGLLVDEHEHLQGKPGAGDFDPWGSRLLSGQINSPVF